MTSAGALSVSRLNAGYGRQQVLHELNLEVKPNAITVIVGPNGAGKTTLAACIAGMVKIQSGDIRWKGETVRGRSTKSRVRSGLSLVPQGAPCFPHMTTRQNVLASSSSVKRHDDYRTRADYAMALFPELTQRASQPAGTLSGGQRQMLALARAISQLPEFLVLDEPSFGLAVGVRQRVVEALQRLKEARKATILVVEQDLNMVRQLSDSVYYMAHGQVEPIEIASDHDSSGVVAQPTRQE